MQRARELGSDNVEVSSVCQLYDKQNLFLLSRYLVHFSKNSASPVSVRRFIRRYRGNFQPEMVRIDNVVVWLQQRQIGFVILAVMVDRALMSGGVCYCQICPWHLWFME